MYRKEFFKSATREKRGSGTRREVFPSTRFPSNWQSFLLVDDNTELVSLLAQQAITLPIEEGDRVLTLANRSDLRSLELCNHEEADTRLLVHVLDACSYGHQRILIKTNDSDVVVLAVSVAENLPADEFGLVTALESI